MIGLVMTNSLEDKKKKIDEQIEKNILRKKNLLNKEKRQRAAKFSNIGRMAYQANIDQIDEQALFGAFLEIAEKLSEEKLNHWKTIAKEFSQAKSKNSDLVFSISFLEEPDKEVKQKLKENKFMWNRFRKEFYGKGQKSEIENLLQGCKFKIEEIQD